MPEHHAEQRLAYGRFIKKKQMTLIIATVTTVLVALIAISAGSLSIPLPDVVRALFGSGDPTYQTAILSIRLPRVLTAILVGTKISYTVATSFN